MSIKLLNTSYTDPISGIQLKLSDPLENKYKLWHDSDVYHLSESWVVPPLPSSRPESFIENTSLSKNDAFAIVEKARNDLPEVTFSIGKARSVLNIFVPFLKSRIFFIYENKPGSCFYLNDNNEDSYCAWCADCYNFILNYCHASASGVNFEFEVPSKKGLYFIPLTSSLSQPTRVSNAAEITTKYRAL